MPNANVPSPAAGGQAAPAAPGKQQTGAAAPASNGTPAGTPSSPSAEAALVEAKRQAEHWRKKYERDVQPMNERLAKLEGLAQGLGANGQPAPKAPAKTLADLDDTSLDAVVKKGIEDSNPDYVAAAAREMANRIAEQKIKESEARMNEKLALSRKRDQTNAKILNDFPDALNEDSELRQGTDRLIGEYERRDPQFLDRHPEALYGIFAQVERGLRASDREDLGRLRQQEADRLAREELERSNQVIATTARKDVAEDLARGDIRSAIRKRLPFITERGAR